MTFNTGKVLSAGKPREPARTAADMRDGLLAAT